jgi:S1-C subfamily serine protease
VIRSLGREPAPDAESLTRAPAGARPGQAVTLTVARGDQTLTVGATPGELPGS